MSVGGLTTRPRERWTHTSQTLLQQIRRKSWGGSPGNYLGTTRNVVLNEQSPKPQRKRTAKVIVGGYCRP
jgi:hypothetical protein